jgi:hypothetical protein
MVRFFATTNRVLSDGGWLVIDSPNRDVTAALGWSMAEHTVEFSSDEVRRLFGLAGFELETIKGVWLCREDDQLLPLDPVQDKGGAGSVLRRMVLATGRPRDAFIWWAEGRKRADPHLAELSAFIHRVFADNWSERVSRLQVLGERERGRTSDGTATVICRRGSAGDVLIGPWMALPAGGFSFEIDIAWRDKGDDESEIASLELRAGDDLFDQTKVTAERPSGSTRARVAAQLPETRFGVHVVLGSSGNAELEVPLQLTLSPDPWPAG